MIKGTITKTGNSYAIRVPIDYIRSNNLQLGDTIFLDSPHGKQKDVLQRILARAQGHGAVSVIPDPVAWQRAQRRSTDPWEQDR